MKKEMSLFWPALFSTALIHFWTEQKSIILEITFKAFRFVLVPVDRPGTTGTDWVPCGHRFGLNAGVDIGLSVDNGHRLTLTHCHSSGLHPVLTSALLQMLLPSCVHLLTLLLPFGSFFNKQHSLEVKSFQITVQKEEKAVSLKKN